MRQIDDPKFRAILASLGEVYSKQISPQLASLFWEALKDLPIEAVDQGARSWIKHGKNFPRPANLRDMVTQLSQAAPKALVDQRQAEEPQDHLLFFANRLFLKYAGARLGMQAELAPARNALRDLVDEFCGYIREGDELATPAAFAELLCKILKIPRSLFGRFPDDPFPQFMGRELNARYARAA